MTTNLNHKTEKLQEQFVKYQKPCIAFSGGVDSTLLLWIAAKMKVQAVALTVDGEMLPRSELEEACKLAKAAGIRHQVISVDIFKKEEIIENGPRRCYFCKRYIFEKLKDKAAALGCDVLFDGTNLDDFNDYRPGLKALEELKVISPFVEAKMTKEDIRKLSAVFGLQTAKKPAMACLATRIQTGEKIEKTKLKRIEEGEEQLKQQGLTQYRLRMVNDQTAKIECGEEDFEKIVRIREYLVKELKAIGFKNILLDLQGYRQGSMNEVNTCEKKN